jgi:hypothetical protein
MDDQNQARLTPPSTFVPIAVAGLYAEVPHTNGTSRPAPVVGYMESPDRVIRAVTLGADGGLLLLENVRFYYWQNRS